MTCTEIETMVARKWNIRQNIIVPNVSWGLNIHECDLLVVSKSNWATEIEIKVSKSDLKKDAIKKHEHKSKKIKYLYFAIPESLEKDIDLIPERAGIIIIREEKPYQTITGETRTVQKYVDIIREPKRNEQAIKLADSEVMQLSRLGCMRIWGLKNTIVSLLKDNQHLRNKAEQTKMF